MAKHKNQAGPDKPLNKPEALRQLFATGKQNNCPDKGPGQWFAPRFHARLRAGKGQARHVRSLSQIA